MFQKIGSPYLLVYCSWRKKDMIKSNTSLKRWFWVEEYKALKISETLNFADFKYVFRFFISFFHQKLQPILPTFAHF